MQYYRLWIYSCNVVLGLTSAIFIIFAAFVVADVRLSLLQGVELYHPTFFYAYGALILQCGVVQTIGCLGAQRLSHKLLSLYWTLLLLLTLGDVGVGLYWVFHLEKIKIDLRPYLNKEFISKYSIDETFTLKWNKIQSQDQCCGVDGPLDFEQFSTSQLHHSKQTAFTSNSHVFVGVESGLLSLPESCCTLFYVPPTISSSSSSGPGLDKTYRISNHPSKEEHPPFNGHPSDPSSSVLPNDDHHKRSSGNMSGRRGRTPVNFRNRRLKSSSDLPDDNDDEDDDDDENSFYNEYTEDSPSQVIPSAELVVVPERNVSELTRRNTTVQNRDIKTYEPIHTHKIRHELHRKSQMSVSQTDFKSINSTSLVLESRINEPNQTFEKFNEVSSETLHKSSHGVIGEKRHVYSLENSSGFQNDLIGLKNEEIYVPYIHHHNHDSHKKTNKLFPSISFRVRKRKRRETRALSVTQVPDVSTPIQTRVVCHRQPKGLNHHNSYRKYLLDQRKATEDKQEANTVPNTKKMSTDWLYWNTIPASKSTSVIGNKVGLVQPTKAEFTSAEIMKKTGANEIANHTKNRKWESLVAKRKFQRVMAPFTDSPTSSLHSFTLLPFSSSKREGTANSKESRTIGRQTRNTKMSMRNSNPDSENVLQMSTFITEKRKRSARQVKFSQPNSDNLAESYFSPFSSSASSSYLEANYPRSAVVSTSTLANEVDKGSGYAANNSSNDEVQKTLYVYGVGCGVKLTEWVDHVSGIMFILGFCIIGFAKTCFLVILRTEIREMIEKIHMIEPEEVMSPSRANSKDQRFHVSHPLLQNPHRASTVSAHGSLLPTIKSPDGPSTSVITTGMIGGYNRPNRHYLRRASNIVGGDRSRSHSNETVNMTLLMATSVSNTETGVREKLRSNPNLSSAGGSSTGTIANLEERDPVSGLSITVPSGGSTTGSGYAPVGAARYLRRSSTCSSSTNPYGYPYGCGFDGEPRPGPSSRFYQYFEPLYQTPHLYQQHHHHHYTRNRSHSRNMSCGAILPLASFKANSFASAMTAHRGPRNFSSATTGTASNVTSSGGYSLSSTSKDENEMIISVSLEHIALSDQDEEDAEATAASGTLAETEEEKEQEKKDWAAAISNIESSAGVKSSINGDDCLGTKLQTFTHTEVTNETIASGGESRGAGEMDLQRRNGNNNLDTTNSLPISYIGTPV